MRKLLTILLFLSAAVVSAQNFQLHRDISRDQFTSTLEMFRMDIWGNTYTFVDFDYNGGNVNSAYFEIARVLKSERMPIGIHLEYNGGTSNNGSFDNAWIWGANYSVVNERWGWTIYAGYKAIKGAKDANFQITGIWNITILDEKIIFSGFADLWSQKGTYLGTDVGKTVFLSEPQLWYIISPKISLGGEVEIAKNFGNDKAFKLRPTLAIKWNF